MLNKCPECGAALITGTSCQSIFDEFLVLEFNDPAFGEVHMLTVACFMIQHNRYSDEALAWIEKQLHAALEEGLSPIQIRKRSARETSQAERNWKVTRRAGERQLPRVNWSITIADVSTGFKDAESYCSLIRSWAHTTLAEMRPLLHD